MPNASTVYKAIRGQMPKARNVVKGSRGHRFKVSKHTM